MGEKIAYKPRFTAQDYVDTIWKTNGMVTLAAKSLGVTPWAIWKRAKRDPKIQEAIKMAREEMIDLAESKLRIAILNGEPWAIALTLKTIGKDRGYVERVEQTGKDGDAIETKTTLYLPTNSRDVIDVAAVETKKLNDRN